MRAQSDESINSDVFGPQSQPQYNKTPPWLTAHLAANAHYNVTSAVNDAVAMKRVAVIDIESWAFSFLGPDAFKMREIK